MSSLSAHALDNAIAGVLGERIGELAPFVSALVREPSTLGDEEPAQQMIADRLTASGFTVERVQVDSDAALADPHAGYPPLSYDGRSSVVGVRRGKGGGRSLHLSGHVDVVPVDPDAPWSHGPWSGEIADGRIWGRGSGDMKGGLAAYLLAAEVVADVCPEAQGDLVFSSVIEEECGGNGMWSVLHAGYRTDATLIGEPTGLAVVHAGTGVVWARLIRARGQAGHSANRGGDGPFDELARAIAALRAVEAEANEGPLDAVFAAVSEWPYGMTVGRIGGGVWTSSAPASLEASVRFGLGLGREPAEVQARIVEAVAGASPAVEVSFEAFRAPAYQPWHGRPIAPRSCERPMSASPERRRSSRRSRRRPTPARRREHSATALLPESSTAPTNGSTSPRLEQTTLGHRADRGALQLTADD